MAGTPIYHLLHRLALAKVRRRLLSFMWEFWLARWLRGFLEGYFTHCLIWVAPRGAIMVILADGVVTCE